MGSFESCSVTHSAAEFAWSAVCGMSLFACNLGFGGFLELNVKLSSFVHAELSLVIVSTNRQAQSNLPVKNVLGQVLSDQDIDIQRGVAHP